MHTQSGNNFDAASDVCEIGLMAATSPDFAEALIRALIAAGECAAAPNVEAETAVA